MTARPYLSRRATALLICALAALGAAVALAVWPGQLRLRHTLLTMGCAAFGSMATLVLVARERRRVVLPGQALSVVAAAGAGWVVWHHRQRLERIPDLAAWVRLDEAALPQSGAAAETNADFEGRLFDHFRTRPPKQLDTLPESHLADVPARADNLLRSVYKILEFPDVKLPEHLTWNENPLKDRTWEWGLHAMPFVEVLTQRFNDTRDLRYLARAESLVLGWCEQNFHYLYQPPSRFSWHDHNTALRVRAWLPFWEEWIHSGLSSAEEAITILETIIAHGEKLADPDFYTPSHNHGMEQDLALLAITAAFPELSVVNAWRELALRRLREQLDLLVSPQGVQLEHSPGYHVFMMDILIQLQELITKNGIDPGSVHLEQLLAKMARFAALALRPDGRLVPVGATFHEEPCTIDHPTLGRFAAIDPLLRFALTRGREGEGGPTSVVYADEGYAVFRDAWRPAPDFESSFYLFFTAAAHEGRAHKQWDDLSFVLFAAGRDLLIDGGFHSYDYGNPDREYLTSSVAHNTVIMDGVGFEGFTGKIEAQASGNEYAVVQASHENYPGFRHRRTLFYGRPASVFIIDELEPVPGGAQAVRRPAMTGPAMTGAALASSAQLSTPVGTHDFEQLFHFPNELDVAADADGPVVTARPKGGSVAIAGAGFVFRIASLSGSGVSAQVLCGSREPRRGWASRAYHSIEPTPVAIFRARGSSVRFITVLTVEPENAAPGPLRSPTCAESPDGSSFLLHWPTGGKMQEARLVRKPALRVEK